MQRCMIFPNMALDPLASLTEIVYKIGYCFGSVDSIVFLSPLQKNAMGKTDLSQLKILASLLFFSFFSFALL